MMFEVSVNEFILLFNIVIDHMKGFARLMSL